MNGVLNRLPIASSFSAKRVDIDAMFTTGKSPIDTGKRRIRTEWSLVAAALPPRFWLRLIDGFPVHPRLEIKLSLEPLV
jgi:hypothetical protein